MFHDLDYCLRTIDRMDFRHFHAYHPDGTTMDTADAKSKADLGILFADLVNNTSGTITFNCWQDAPVRPAGVRKADMPATKAERVTWRVRGMLGVAAAPVGSVTIERQEPTRAAPVDLQAEQERWFQQGRAHAANEALLKEMRDTLAELRNGGGDDPDEPEPEPEPLLDRETIRELIVVIKQAFVRPAAQPIAGAPEMTATEGELLQAFRRYAAANPSEAQGLAQMVMTDYGPNAPPKQPAPAPNGQQ